MIQAEVLQKLRRKLEEELAHLLGHMEATKGRQGQRAGGNLDRDDLAHNFALREQRLALRDVKEMRLAQIEKALANMADGTYGTCDACGKAIAMERLEIIPYATLCIRCQQEQDQS